MCYKFNRYGLIFFGNPFFSYKLFKEYVEEYMNFLHIFMLYITCILFYLG